MNNPSKAVLLLGSNQGDRLDYLSKAGIRIKAEIGDTQSASDLYETVAWGFKDQPDFLNQVIVVATLLSPSKLLETILKIEKDLGRSRTEKWQQRTIDIDILFFDDSTVNTPDLIIPHPMIAERRFTLIPLAELIPGYIHPVYKKSVSQLLEECNDKSHVRKFQLISG